MRYGFAENGERRRQALRGNPTRRVLRLAALAACARLEGERFNRERFNGERFNVNGREPPRYVHVFSCLRFARLLQTRGAVSVGVTCDPFTGVGNARETLPHLYR